MTGAVHGQERIWVNGEPVLPSAIRVNDKLDAMAQNGVRRVAVTKTTQGQGKGTIWLHGASGARIRCLRDQRLMVSVNGTRRARRADRIKPGDFVYGVVSGHLCVDPIVGVTSTVESVPAVWLEIPSCSLVSEEGLMFRVSCPAS